MKENVDVLVIGGGTAGTIAAVQAGRTGLRTALIESGSQLGGVTTTGGVSFPGLFHAWVQDEARHLRVDPGPGPQLRVPMRIGKKPDVEDHVGVGGKSVLEPEGDHGDVHGTGLSLPAEPGHHPLPQLMDVEVGGVDDQVRSRPQTREQIPFQPNGRRQRLAALRVGTPGLLIAADEHLIVGVQENHRRVHPGLLQAFHRPSDRLIRTHRGVP